MNAAAANQLRSQILDLQASGASPEATAARLGCARSTVYKVLRTPGPDRRTRRRAALVALEPHLRALLSANPDRSADELLHLLARRSAHLPARATLARLLFHLRRTLPGPDETPPTADPPPDAPTAETTDAPAAVDADPYAGLPGYDPAAGADVAGRPEVALVRSMLRSIVQELGSENTPLERQRLRAQLALLTGAIARTRAAPARPLRRADQAAALAAICEEVLS